MEPPQPGGCDVSLPHPIWKPASTSQLQTRKGPQILPPAVPTEQDTQEALTACLPSDRGTGPGDGALRSPLCAVSTLDSHLSPESVAGRAQGRPFTCKQCLIGPALPLSQGPVVNTSLDAGLLCAEMGQVGGGGSQVLY